MRIWKATAVLMTALALGACGSTGGNLFGQPQQAAQPAPQTPPGVGSPVHNALFGQPVPAGPQTLTADACPRIEVRDGSAVWRQGGEGPTELRYQGTITDQQFPIRNPANGRNMRKPTEPVEVPQKQVQQPDARSRLAGHPDGSR